MPSILHVFLCSGTALLFWSTIGLSVSRPLLPPPLRLAAAPALGWAVHSALAVPLYSLIGFTPFTGALGSLAALVAAGFLLRFSTVSEEKSVAAVPAWCFLLAALLAAIPAAALFPKFSGDAVALAGPIFDHAKIAIVDEIARLGMPPGNPFIADAGPGGRLAYYYLWHFSAAELSLLHGVNGWEADIALSAFTAFASIALMMGFAVWIGGRTSAALWVAPLAFAASLHPVLEAIFGSANLYNYLLPPTGFAGWLFQTTWAPQHIASGSCVLLSAFLMQRLAQRPSALAAVALSLTAVAGFESSTWVGGLLFAAAAPVIAAILLASVPASSRLRFCISVLTAASLAAALAYPFLRDQFFNAAGRGIGSPIAFEPYEVLDFPDSDLVRRVLDIPAFWLVLLMIEFPAIYIPGIISFIGMLPLKPAAEPALLMARLLGALALASLLVAAFFTSTLAENNDLGWRAVLPATLVLTIFAATGLARWLRARAPWNAALGIGLLLLSLPRSYQLASENLRGEPPSVAGKAFLATQEMWQAVRSHTPPAERAGNNPLFMADMTPWPVNISWALFADRASCFAGRELVLPYSSLSPGQVDAAEEQFERLFAGRGSASDVRDLATRFQCRTVVLTAQDGAWANDPFAGSRDFDLAEEKAGAWKIYRAR